MFIKKYLFTIFKCSEKLKLFYTHFNMCCKIRLWRGIIMILVFPLPVFDGCIRSSSEQDAESNELGCHYLIYLYSMVLDSKSRTRRFWNWSFCVLSSETLFTLFTTELFYFKRWRTIQFFSLPFYKNCSMCCEVRLL